MKLILLLFFASVAMTQYTPDWESIDSRPLPQWFDDAKVGIFMHFGPYSVPGFKSEWFWMQADSGDEEVLQYIADYYPPKFQYHNFGPMITMEFFNATDMARIVEDSGAKYIVFTSKHHDGFCNWDSTFSYGWNSMAVGAKRDVLTELKEAFDVNHPDLHFGLYHSLYEWFNPRYLSDRNNNYTTRDFVTEKMLPELKELINKFAPHVLWSDGDWEAPSEYWGSQEFLAWLYNESPSKDVIVTNDRWGIGAMMTHGGYYSGPDRFSPGTLQAHKWENAMTIDWHSWGIRRNMYLDEVMSAKDIIKTITTTVSCGGNILVNVGPTKEGTIIPIFQERLAQMGQWLRTNDEAIYSSRPWSVAQNDSTNPNVWYTSKGNTVYAIVLEWPENEELHITSPTSDHLLTSVSMLGFSGGNLEFEVDTEGTTIHFPSMTAVVKECGNTCLLAQVLKIETEMVDTTITTTTSTPTTNGVVRMGGIGLEALVGIALSIIYRR